MPKLNARHLDSSPVRPRLAAVPWSVPSTEPDTTEVDESWFEESPRHSVVLFKGAPEAPLQVAYDVWDSPHALVVLVDLPGVEEQHVSLSLGSQALYLQISVPESEEPRLGLQPGTYDVRVEAPVASGPDAIDAALSHGLLRIRIKKEPAGARRVAIVSHDGD